MSNSFEENKKMLLKLLKANATDEIGRIVQTDDFFKNVKWPSYGGFSNNSGTVEGQMKVAENALLEKVSNSIDAILMRKCWEQGINPKDKTKAPYSMSDAIQRYFGGRNNLRKNRSQIAKESLWLVADGKKERPTLTVIDVGEGQQPNRIKDTIVSLHAENKKKVPFVYGKYNQGGSSALGFTGDPMSLHETYLQLVLCRRAETIKDLEKDDNYDHFGFTLVRKRFDEDSYTYEYLTDRDGNIFSFPFDEPIDIYGFKFKEGCVIRLYEYQLTRPGHIVFKGLNYFIDSKLAEMPLPMYMLETRNYSGGKDTSVFGLKERLANKIEIFREGYPQIKTPIDLGSIGKREADLFVLKHKVKQAAKADIETYLEETDKIFFIKDGMTLHTENTNWLRNQCDLPDLAPYVYVFIDISNIDPALAQMLHSGRESFKLNENTIQVLDRLRIFLSGENFRQLNKEYAALTGTGEDFNDEELTKQLIKDISVSPELRELFETGEDFTFKKEEQGTKEPVEKYKGSYLPESFDLIGEPEREVEEDSYARISFETKADDNLFDRAEDRGEYDWAASQKFDITFYGLKQGKVTFRVDPKPNLKVGEQDTLLFYLKVPSKSLKFESKVVFVLKEKIKYEGKAFPTHFTFPKKELKVPVKLSRALRLETDAENNYFKRTEDKGSFKLEGPKELEYGKPRLKNGLLVIKVMSLKNKVKKLDPIKIEIQDSKNKFQITVPCEVISLDTNPSLKLPKPVKISRDNWEKDTPVWTTLSIARVPSWNELTEIKINIDSKPFEDLKLQNLEDKEKALDILFRQIYVSAIWSFFEFKELKVTESENGTEKFSDTRDLVFDKAMKANAKYLLQNIKKFL
jgi:hypothetical protein